MKNPTNFSTKEEWKNIELERDLKKHMIFAALKDYKRKKRIGCTYNGTNPKFKSSHYMYSNMINILDPIIKFSFNS